MCDLWLHDPRFVVTKTKVTCFYEHPRFGESHYWQPRGEDVYEDLARTAAGAAGELEKCVPEKWPNWKESK